MAIGPNGKDSGRIFQHGLYPVFGDGLMHNIKRRMYILAGIDLKSMTIEELSRFLAEMGEPKFRAKQVFCWLHQKGVLSFDEMSNLPVSLRENLRENCYINSFSIVRKLSSQLDGTVKYLLELPDGEYVQTVLMSY